MMLDSFADEKIDLMIGWHAIIIVYYVELT